MSLQKEKPVRNKKYLRYVATLPCANCGLDDDTVVAHHIIGVGQGCMGGKASDLEVMPLCYDCHLEIHLCSHSKGVRREQYKWVMETLIKAIKDEVEALSLISF